MHCAVNPLGNDTCRWEFTRHHSLVFMDLAKKGVVADLIGAGAIISTLCSAAMLWRGDTPINNGLEYSPHHVTSRI